jgi:cysteine-rich repeat protein
MVATEPITRIYFDEGAGGDDIGIKDFFFVCGSGDPDADAPQRLRDWLDPNDTGAMFVDGSDLDQTCTTVAATDVPQTIDDAPEPAIGSYIHIPFSGTVLDVNVHDLEGTHNSVGDIVLQLQHGGASSNLLWQNCGSADNFDLDLDDEAGTGIPCPPTDGAAHQPVTALSSFDGLEAQGFWSLVAQDYVDNGLSGTLDGWSLEVCVPRRCGNGLIDGSEQCDDGNQASGDGCSARCDVEVCEVAVSTDVPKTIPTSGSVLSSASVTGTSGAISDVDVSLAGSHGRISDMNFRLLSPEFVTGVDLMAQVCPGFSGFDLELDDEAGSGIQCPPTDGGAHTPSEPLSGFDGLQSTGDWLLISNDLVSGTGGTLDSWSLDVCATPCTTFVDTDLPLDIPDNGSVSATINVPISGRISDVNVRSLAGTHTYMSDLEFHLKAPGAPAADVTVINNVCPNLPGFDLELDDEAGSGIPCPPTDGADHTPSSSLSAFDGRDPQGDWELEIFDQASVDTGTLDSWALEICFSACGNGILEPGEDCDDGNASSGDCCSATCGFESSGSSCDADGSLCTDGDTCNGAGVCNAGPPLDCDDANVCTNDSCNPASGCVNTNNTNPCDDGDPCTVGDVCGSGICTAQAPLICDDGDVCTDDSCNPATGCEYTNNTDPCDDGDACTVADTCAGGSCQSGAPLDCDDGVVCTDDICNPATGCEYAFNTGSCDDGNACTVGDYCSVGNCIPQAPLDCDDGDVCTADSCDQVTGCAHAPIPGCGVPIPALSPGGKSLLSLLVVAAGAVLLGRRGRRAA